MYSVKNKTRVKKGVLRMDGAKANNNGNLFEGCVEDVLKRKGFEVVKHSVWVKNPGMYGDNLLIRNSPYFDLTGHSGRMEFRLLSKIYNLNARIECRIQFIGGSVDEKYPKLYLDCISEHADYDKTIIIVDGGGQRKKYIDWLKTASQTKLFTDITNNHKEIEILTLIEFVKWVADLEVADTQPILFNGAAIC